MSSNKVLHSGVILGKLAVLLFLLVSAFLKPDTTYIASNPKGFLTDCSLAGVGMLMSVFVLGKNRNTEWKHLLDIMFILFFMTFVYQVAFVMSGHHEDSEHGSHNAKISIMDSITIASAVLLFMAAIKNKNLDFVQSNKVKTVIESLLIAFFAGGPAALASSNQGHSKSEAMKHGLQKAGTYLGFYYLLQGSGFFDEEFHYHSKKMVPTEYDLKPTSQP